MMIIFMFIEILPGQLLHFEKKIFLLQVVLFMLLVLVNDNKVRQTS